MEKKLINKLFNIIDPLRLKTKKTSKILLIADRGNIDVAIRTSIFAKIVNEKKKLNVVVISDFKENISHEIYKKNNILKLIKFSEFLNKNKFNPILWVKFLTIYFKFIYNFVFKKNYIDEFIKKYSINDIKVGDIFYDFYIRKNLNFLHMEKINFKFLSKSFKSIFIVLNRIEFLEEIFSKYDVKIAVSSAKGYMALGNLLLRLSIQKKCNTLLLSGAFIKEYKKIDECYITAFRFTNNEIKHYDKLISNKKIDQYYDNKFNKLKLNYKNQAPYVVHATFLKAYNKSSPETSIKKILSYKKKICVLALNCFSDAPHYQGPIIFRDFYEHFIKTINFLASTEPSNEIWLIKPHPAVDLYGEKGLIEKHIKKINKNFIIMCPKNLSNMELFKHTDYLVTAISSIALEYACYGKQPIICAKNAYSGYGFTTEPKSKKHYFSLLKNLKNKSNLHKDQINKARRIYYYLDNFTNANTRPGKLLPNRDNGKYENYIKKLQDNYLKNSKKNSILYDDYYKDLNKKISVSCFRKF